VTKAEKKKSIRKKGAAETSTFFVESVLLFRRWGKFGTGRRFEGVVVWVFRGNRVAPSTEYGGEGGVESGKEHMA